MNRPFVLSFENDNDRTSYKWYFFTNEEINDYNIKIDGCFFYQPAKNDLRTYDKIQKNATGQGDDYATAYLRD